MKQDNRGGLAKILAIPVENVTVVKNWVKDDVFPEIDDLTKVITLPTWGGQDWRFKEDGALGDHGQKYDVRISGKFPKRAMRKSDRDRLSAGGFIVIHMDRMGDVKLSGTKEVPLSCTLKEDSGAAETEMEMLQFEFSAIESEVSWHCSLVDLDHLENI